MDHAPAAVIGKGLDRDSVSNRLLARLYRKAPWVARRRYARRCEAVLGGQHRVALLSFDCDNPEDIPACRTLAPFLDKHGIRAAFAVPGEILRQGRETFAGLARAGHEFMGHGFLRHSEIRDGAYHSTLFYHRLGAEALTRDILQGNEAVDEVTGQPPQGFRIPHFGHSNSYAELTRVYAVLGAAGLRYSSSTLPFFAVRHGPLFPTAFGLQELPISPSFDRPLTILDTYSHGFDPRNPTRRFAEYADGFRRMATMGPGLVINSYCDPSQAMAMEGWWHQAIDHLVARGFTFLTPGAFLDRYCPGQRSELRRFMV